MAKASWADSTTLRNYFLDVSVFSHSLSLPLTASNKLLSFRRLPGMRVSFGRPINKTPRKLGGSYKGAFSAYHQKELHYGYELAGLLEGFYQATRTLAFHADLGLGYLHTFEDASQYHEKNSVLTQKADWGRPQGTAQLGLGLRYRITNYFELTADYGQVLQGPFARKAGVFMVPHTRIYLGLRYSIVT